MGQIMVLCGLEGITENGFAGGRSQTFILKIMLLNILKAKLHHLRITNVDLEYEGSLAIDPELLKAAGILPNEKILVANMANGERFETYAIPGEPGGGQVCLNGAAAHKGKAGDRLIVLAFCLLDSKQAVGFQPKTVRLDARNRIVG